jgi:ABC-type xylose transport system permease subunit
MTSFPEKTSAARSWKSTLASQEFGLILANLTAWLAILLLDPQHNFASIDSARLLLREGVLLGIYAIGAAIVIVAGGIDLSTGSVIAFRVSSRPKPWVARAWLLISRCPFGLLWRPFF